MLPQYCTESKLNRKTCKQGKHNLLFFFFFPSSRIVSSHIISILPNLRNLTEEKPPCPSNTAANENPSRPSHRTTTSSSISSRGPCWVVEPQRTPATAVKDDGASIAIAEQHRLLALVEQVDFLGGFKLELLEWSFVSRNFCNCGLSSAIAREFESNSVRWFKVLENSLGRGSGGGGLV
jgi:hypothetical protein